MVIIEDVANCFAYIFLKFPASKIKHVKFYILIKQL